MPQNLFIKMLINATDSSNVSFRTINKQREEVASFPVKWMAQDDSRAAYKKDFTCWPSANPSQRANLAKTFELGFYIENSSAVRLSFIQLAVSLGKIEISTLSQVKQFSLIPLSLLFVPKCIITRNVRTLGTL